MCSPLPQHLRVRLNFLEIFQANHSRLPSLTAGVLLKSCSHECGQRGSQFLLPLILMMQEVCFFPGVSPTIHSSNMQEGVLLSATTNNVILLEGALRQLNERSVP